MSKSDSDGFLDEDFVSLATVPVRHDLSLFVEKEMVDFLALAI